MYQVENPCLNPQQVIFFSLSQPFSILISFPPFFLSIHIFIPYPFFFSLLFSFPPIFLLFPFSFLLFFPPFFASFFLPPSPLSPAFFSLSPFFLLPPFFFLSILLSYFFLLLFCFQIPNTNGYFLGQKKKKKKKKKKKPTYYFGISANFSFFHNFFRELIYL